MNEIKKIYFVGIGGIGVSGLARYYLSEGYRVYGSDSTHSQLIESLRQDGCDIIIGSDDSRIDTSFQKFIYSEAVPAIQNELKKAKDLGISCLKYNQALGEVVNNYTLIAVSGTHGKSTTSSMISQIMLASNEKFKSIVGTLLKEFNGKNFYTSLGNLSQTLSYKEREQASKNSYFIIEACEHKEHFLEYKPALAVITNIEYDHADYFKTPESYVAAYGKFIDNIRPGGFCILDGNDINSQSFLGKRNDIGYIQVFDSYFQLGAEKISFPKISLSIPGAHILFDAKLAYIAGHMLGVSDSIILKTLVNYSGVWRRMEKIGYTLQNNLLMSDYAHHPTEIITTLRALKQGNPDKKLYVIFQPHQYSRTIELLDGFKVAFSDADSVVIPDIYESRDSEEDKQKINSKKLAEQITHHNIIDGQGLENTIKIIHQYDRKNPDSSIILLLGAGNIDNLREHIKTR